MDATMKADVDRVLETTIYLYTESRRLTKALARRASLTGPQLTVLKLLEEVGHLSLSDLSERIRAQNSTVTGIIDRMERDELVVRERLASDRRVVLIRLTQRGEAIARAIPVEPMEMFKTALLTLSPSEMGSLVAILTKLARRIEALIQSNRVDARVGGATETQTP